MMLAAIFLAADTSLVKSTSHNFVIDYFRKGGPIMWPILLVSIIAVTVVIERALWWFRQNSLRESSKLEKVFGYVEQGDLKAASELARPSQDPRIRTVWHGLNHHHSTMQSALQVASGLELQRASRFLPVMDTTITLAPLLGLLGTVTGIMGAFKAVGENGLQVDAVSSGIGEALIATSCGLAIAMGVLIPYNYFVSRAERMRFELDTASTNLEVMLQNLNREHATSTELGV